MHGGQHPRIRVEKLGEIVVCGMLTTKDSAGLGHFCLDKRVPHSRAYRSAAVFLNDLRHSLRRDQIVNDCPTRLLCQVTLRHNPADC